MKRMYTTSLALLLATTLAACSDKAPSAATDPADEPATLIGKAVKEASKDAREELANGNIELSATDHPDAEITPTGELLIDGKTVKVNAEQKALLLEYRGHVAAIAEAGIGIGLKGADLAGKAVTEALKGVFTGNTDQIEKKIEAEAEGIKQSAQKLCERLPAMKITQDKLAASLPEFKPYATMDQSDVDDCMSEDGNRFSYDAGKDIGREIGKAIKDRTNDSDGRRDAAEEAEAASAEGTTTR